MPRRARTYRIGLISDTHGLLRPEAVEYLRASDFIIHAGDIGHPSVLAELAEIAPVTAVRGNNDRSVWASGIPVTDVLEVDSVAIYIIHDLAELEIDPTGGGFHAVVAGHSHRPPSEVRDGVLFCNPGSAGPRRFRLPVSVGRLLISGGELTAELCELRISGRG
ncbi:MAG: metallophosphoesterase family protein [Betaproteobacteria bacterium]|nr:metallophosphoesterase family protein [Betaproteobacteria bacterium]